MNLTPKQKRLVEMGKQNGYISLSDFRLEYASPIARKECIQRFLILKLIKETDSVGMFKFIKDE